MSKNPKNLKLENEILTIEQVVEDESQPEPEQSSETDAAQP